MSRLKQAESKRWNAVKWHAKKAARNAVLVSSLLVSGLMLSGKVNAEDKVVKQPDKALSVRVMGGTYNKGQDPFVGVGLSGHLGYEHVKFDAAVDGIFKDFKGMELDNAELDVTFPAGPVALTGYAYRSAYLGVDVGAGVTLHIPKANLHISPNWFRSGDMDGIPLTVFWTPQIGDRLNLTFKVIIQTMHIVASKSGPFLGGEIIASVKVTDKTKIYGRVFEMTARGESGNMFVGAASAQAGVEMDF